MTMLRMMMSRGRTRIDAENDNVEEQEVDDTEEEEEERGGGGKRRRERTDHKTPSVYTLCGKLTLLQGLLGGKWI